MDDKRVNFAISADDKTRAAFSSVQSGLRGLSGGVSAMTAAIGALAGTAGLATIASQFVQVNMEAQKLRASLTTVTGGTQSAAAAFEMLSRFAATTPFQLSEVTSAFIKMQALGLNPTEDTLRSFGNTASAMGKSLEQFVEAVADAATGEFERLKEFGIKAKSEGENVTFTFQGVSTTVRKSAEEISSYLEQIGNNQFAGAMEQQMKTLGGAVSNLSDSWFRLMDAFGQTGAVDLAAEGVNGLTGAIDRLRKAIRPTVDEELADLKDELRSINEQIATAKLSGGLAFLWGDLEGRKAEIQGKLGELQWAKGAAANLPPGMLEDIMRDDARLGGKTPAGSTAGKAKKTQQQDYLERLAIDTASFNADEFDQQRRDLRSPAFATANFAEELFAQEIMLFEMRQQLAMDTAAFNQEMFDQEIALQQGRIEWENRVTQSKFANAEMAFNILAAVAGKSKAAAIAGIALQKGLAMAEIFVSTQAAAAAALAPPPLGLGPVIGAPLAAAVEAQGYIRMALVAASGLAQAAQVSSGSQGESLTSGMGTYGAPYVTQPSQQQPQQQALTIVVQGNVIGEEAWVENNLIPAINAAYSRNVTLEFAR